MRCVEARRRLFDPTRRHPETQARPRGGEPIGGGGDPRLQAHLAGCRPCAALAARLDDARAHLSGHRTEHVPDPAFAARVVARLPDSTELLGWAALRLLPAALALALLCSWYGATRGPGLSDLLLHPEDPQLLTYVALGGDGEAP